MGPLGAVTVKDFTRLADIMGLMFFRREKPPTPTFHDRVETLKAKGYSVTLQPSGTSRVVRANCAVDVPGDARAGILMGNEIGSLVDSGYQKFFRAPSGVKKPATAEELVELHNFEEDLKEALGQKMLYNEALGTVSTFYQYDRVEDRDGGVPKRAWE
jgi:hypothetical protein